MNDLWILSTFLVVVAWILSKQKVEEGPPLYNHDGVVYYDPHKVATPSSLSEVQAVVQKASSKGQRIRPLGSGHSWNNLGESDDIYLSLYKYRGLVKLDKLGGTASFKGGTFLWEINSILASYDLGLAILPSISNQTIGGAVATGTHSSGVGYGSHSTYLTRIQLVTGTGEVLNISAKSDPELFQAAGVSIGLLGIITEVTLKVEPIFNLFEDRQVYALNHCLNNMDSIQGNFDHTTFWIEIASSTCAVFSREKTKQRASEQVISQPWTDIRMYAYEGLIWLLSIFPFATDFSFKLLFSTEVWPEYQRTAISWDVFNIPHYIPEHRESEVAVPKEHCQKSIEDLIAMKYKLNIPVNYIIEVRFVKKDEFWLSNSYGRDVCHFTLLMHNPSDYYWNLYNDVAMNVTRSYGGRPHWGKFIRLDQDRLRELYPRLDDFLKIRKKLDPDGVFLNDPIIKLFGI